MPAYLKTPHSETGAPTLTSLGNISQNTQKKQSGFHVAAPTRGCRSLRIRSPVFLNATRATLAARAAGLLLNFAESWTARGRAYWRGMASGQQRRKIGVEGARLAIHTHQAHPHTAFAK